MRQTSSISFGDLLKQGESLRASLEGGERSAYFKQFDSLFAAIPETEKEVWLEAYMILAAQFLAFMHKNGISFADLEPLDADALLRWDAHSSARQAADYLRAFAGALLQCPDCRDEGGWLESLHVYIEKHLDEDLSLTRLAEAVYFNPSYLCRLYKQTTGRALFDYVAEAKLTRAKRYLKESPRLKVHEIARKVGFGSPAHFTRVFKKHSLLTPAQYREAYAR
ncbi:helix-turn-helix transcriptional regulator [Paenibacillus lignilyticus]|uniref:Helix-turn-helix transcriptional regulator n=1 Tax=Paenibacillus lignilyticus TaxID=1172615 RepID=A0ABS5CFT8_9BACL|nr:AraC family transcriptional regulator [Paenibacillus lignilyticus]MBP3964739.1 helix-turn-helix transcriptional regulator [Paenibacillus lignilyticus]